MGDVTITLAGGDVVHARQDRPRGGPDAPLSRGELEAKFRGNARLALPDARVEPLAGAVSRLATSPDLDALAACLRRTPPSPT